MTCKKIDLMDKTNVGKYRLNLKYTKFIILLNYKTGLKKKMCSVGNCKLGSNKNIVSKSSYI